MKTKTKIATVVVIACVLTGCGWFDRNVAAIAGGASKTCVDGVMYLQFTSGATVAYNKDGTVKTCGNDD